MHLQANQLQINVILGIILGLFVGKQLGVFSAAWLAVKLNIATLPARVTWMELYAIAIICGIGFTMSLFIGMLAFNPSSASLIDSIKIGVIAGSFLSALVGGMLLQRLFLARGSL